MALRLLKKLKPPFLTQIKWKSIAECVDFIYANFNKLIEKIQSLPKSRKQNYMKLIKFNWKELKDAADVITSFIISMEDNNMRIEFVFIKLFSTISKSNALNNQIAKDLSLELLKTYVKNDNLAVSLAAFLLTSDGSLFYNQCNEEDKEYYYDNGISGIKFCRSFNMKLTTNIRNKFKDHFNQGYKYRMEPFIYWKMIDNELSNVACMILSILCSEAPVERLFGGLSYMVDAASNKMKDDLIDAEMVIRMATIFSHKNDFLGNISSQFEQSINFLEKNAFPNVRELIENLDNDNLIPKND